MIFGAERPLAVKEMRRCLADVAKSSGGEASAFAKVKEQDIEAALAELERDLTDRRIGFLLVQVAGGYKFQSDATCGKWLKHLLGRTRRSRLSMPGLETLAIIGYRQPVTRAQIEAIRGVNVDHVMKTLMEMQLVRIVGRSNLPGRPFLYGTTHKFLEHFGLRDLNELETIEPMLIKDALRAREQAAGDDTETVTEAEPPAEQAETPAVPSQDEPDEDEDESDESG
jgi:segregation and condensation protein B